MIKTRILVNGQDLDLTDDVAMALTFNIADIREPEKRNAHYSKQIIVPGTAANNKIFSHVWDLGVSVNSSGDTNYNLGFDPNLKTQVYVIYEGSQIFEGILQLNRITQSHLGYKHDFEVTLSSNMLDLYVSMGEKTLAELNLSKYDHTYNKSEQQNSWATTIKENGVSVPFTLGNGYVYPMIDYGMNNDVDYDVTHFFPAVYFKTIYDAIIAENGFQVSSSFINSTYFKSLIFPYTGGALKLSGTQILNRTHRAESTSTWLSYSSGTTTTDGPIAFQNDSTGLNHDDGNIYNTSTYKMTVAYSGLYKMTFGIDISLIHYPVSSPATTGSKYLGYYELVSYNPSTNTTITLASLPIYASPFAFQFANTVTVVVPSSVNSGDVSGTGTGAVIAVAQLTQNDQIYCRFRGNFNTSSLYSDAGSTALRLNAGSYFESVLQNTTIQEGDTVSMTGMLPATIKQRDFISSVNRIYNLYYESDKNIINKFFVEPRNDFYSSGTTQDWTYKLDESKSVEILPMGELNSRRFLWTWKPDTDRFNKLYTDKWGETYGQRKYEVVNDFLKDEKKNEVIFSPSPLVDRAGSDRIITRIYQLTNNTPTPVTANPRILYYGGVKTTQFPWNYTASSGTTVMGTYPYAGHLDDPASPTYDVNFGVPREVFYTATTYTSNNIFNQYWKQFIDEITDKDSKIVKGYFHLSPVDIERLSFRDTYFFRQQNFRLNKIPEYNPKEPGTTLCEFLMLKNGIPFTTQTKAVKGGVADAFDSDELPPQYTEKVMTGNNQYGGDAMVKGEGNIVNPSARGIIISGNRNSVSSGCENVSLIASSGCTVLPNVKCTSLVNCTGLTVDSTYSGLTVINNSIYGQQNVLFKEATYTALPSDKGKLIIFSISSNVDYNLPQSNEITEGWSVQVKISTSTASKVTVTITDVTQSWGGVDGTTATTHIITTDEINRTYTFRNNVWYITH